MNSAEKLQGVGEPLLMRFDSCTDKLHKAPKCQDLVTLMPPWWENRLLSPWWHWKLGTQCNEPNTQGPMPGFLTQIIAWNISHIFAYIALPLSIICKCYLTQARQHLQAVTGIASIPDSLAAALSLLPSHGSLEASVGYCLQCSQQTKCIAMI